MRLMFSKKLRQEQRVREKKEVKRTQSNKENNSQSNGRSNEESVTGTQAHCVGPGRVGCQLVGCVCVMIRWEPPRVGGGVGGDLITMNIHTVVYHNKHTEAKLTNTD